MKSLIYAILALLVLLPRAYADNHGLTGTEIQTTCKGLVGIMHISQDANSIASLIASYHQVRTFAPEDADMQELDKYVAELEANPQVTAASARFRDEVFVLYQLEGGGGFTHIPLNELILRGLDLPTRLDEIPTGPTR